MEKQDKLPNVDTETMERLLREHRGDLAGLFLRLAWREGLTRKEIHTLTWSGVDFDIGLLRLPDRTVPLEEGTAAFLQRWKKCFARINYDRVAVSPRLGKPVVEQSISALARAALDEVGMTGVTLKDLRYDFILRQIEEHGLPYALRTAGISLTTYKNALAKKLKNQGIEPKITVRAEDTVQNGDDRGMFRTDREYRLWRIMQKEKHTPGGVALWLTKQLGLTVAEIAGLTWPDVDFQTGVLRVSGRDVSMTRGVTGVLQEEYSLRRPGDDPHVILTARSRKPLTVDRLSVLIREILIRGGVDDACAVDIRCETRHDRDWEAVRDHVETKGAITPMAAGELLGVKEAAAWNRLQAMEKAGYLVHVGRKYYSAEKTPPKERLREEIYGFIAEHGTICCAQAEELLGIPSRQIGYILRAMAKDGELEIVSRGRYTAPETKPPDT